MLCSISQHYHTTLNIRLGVLDQLFQAVVCKSVAKHIVSIVRCHCGLQRD